VRAELLERLARLAVGVGANVQPGQVVGVGADLGQEELARAVAAAAYARGAKFVDVRYFDLHVKRARMEHAPDDTLDYVPPWYGERVLALGRERGANIALAGPAAPGAMEGLDPVRIGRDQLPFLPETLTVIRERTLNWTVVPCPTAVWAEVVHPDLGEEEALERLSAEIAHMLRLDADDPEAAWMARLDLLDAVARRLDEQRFDALRFEGPGTDLTVGLLPSSTWQSARIETLEGIVHVANLPTEEVYATPDPQRADGLVRSTRPLVLFDGTVIRGLEVEFQGGRAVRIDADDGAEVLRGRAAIDEGASRLGEVALVDRESRVGGLGTVFYETLLDENAVSHIALGAGDEVGLSDEDRGRFNRSAIHVDFMIGGEEVAVTGITPTGEQTPVLNGGVWQI
jgi:aminopeptidase